MSNEQKRWCIRNMSSGDCLFTEGTQSEIEAQAITYAKGFVGREMWVYERKFVAIAQAPVEITHDGGCYE